MLRYHNITPACFDEAYSAADAAGCRQGLDQTRRLIELPRDHCWLADSEYNRQHLLALQEQAHRVVVAPPFALVDPLLQEANVAAYGASGPRYALFVGRLMPNKGPRTLLRILLAYRHCGFRKL